MEVLRMGITEAPQQQKDNKDSLSLSHTHTEVPSATSDSKFFSSRHNTDLHLLSFLLVLSLLAHFFSVPSSLDMVSLSPIIATDYLARYQDL